VSGENSGLRERKTRRKRRPDERVPEAVQLDGLATLPVEPGCVSRGVDSA
jgi:hypothetical protein